MLNGWQRLWVVLCVISLVFTIVLLVNDIPTKKDVYRSWADDSIKKTFTLKEFKNLNVLRIRNIYKDMSDQMIIEKIQNRFSSSGQEYNLDFSKINEQHELKLKNLFESQSQYAANYLGVWFVLMVVIYTLGWSTGWVIHGFKTE